jgi:hypothetical protein
MIRALYSLITRLHPRQFRDRFGDEMMATFDEALNHGSGIHLVLDGLLSLARQWRKVLDGSVGAPQARIPAIAANLEVLHRRSIVAHNRARKANAAWIVLFLIVYSISENWPLSFSRMAWVLLPVVIGTALILWTHPRTLDGPWESMNALSLKANPRLAELTIQIERLRRWSTSFLSMLVVMSLLQSVPRLLGGYRNLDAGERLTRVVMTGRIWLVWGLVIPLFLRKVNREAYRRLQDEADAIRTTEQGLTTP